MLKVVCVVDKEKTALDRLAQGVRPYHDNIDYKVLAVHPKRPDLAQLASFEVEAKDADIIDWQYFRTAEMLKKTFPWLESKKQILTHNNPYSIEESSWDNYDMNVGNNDYIFKRLGQITTKPLEYIPICVDTDFWTYNPDWEPNKNVIMAANRIESKKGILPVAIACAELNLHFILVGAVSDADYLTAILATTGNVEFHEEISDEKLRELYHKSTIHVCNSVDNFESGTMPVLESMLTGVPVLARPVGHVPDLYNGANMELLKGIPEDVLGIQDKLLGLMSDKKKLADMREAAWKTAKTRNFERRAYQYQKLYRKVLSDETSVSVVVPIFNKPEIIKKCLDAVANQTHKNIEIIVADDNADWNNKLLIEDFAKYTNIPIRYISTSGYRLIDYKLTEDYGLARARNEATIAATGEVMVYCDQRMIMEPTAIEEFLKYLKPRTWLHGNKGGGKTEFIENFSCIYRADIVNAGLFSERMIWYGGLSQETRARIRNQGLRTEYVASAKAIPKGKSSNKNRKRAEIIKSKNRLWKMELE